jgi:hypothetical protein
MDGCVTGTSNSTGSLVLLGCLFSLNLGTISIGTEGTILTGTVGTILTGTVGTISIATVGTISIGRVGTILTGIVGTISFGTLGTILINSVGVKRSSDEVLRRSRRKGISCLKQEKGKLTGLVTACVETAF